MTPEASEFIRWIKLRQAVVGALFRFVPGDARRKRLIHDLTFHSDADAVTLPFALSQGRLPDFDAPRVLAEKVRWTFLHHRNPLMPLISDKIAVRDYLNFKGAQIAPPQLFRNRMEARRHPADESARTFCPESIKLLRREPFPCRSRST